jgi:hypothetical protein
VIIIAAVDGVPASIVTAIALSAAAGKNPFIPLGLLFLLAAPDTIPPILMEPELHAALHQIGPVGLLWSLAAFFLLVACLESVADKISWVETWLVPLSTTWRPFASVAVAAIVGYAVANAGPLETNESLARVSFPLMTAETQWWTLGSVFAITLVGGGIYGWLSTIGKTGVRLLLALVPIPSLKLIHSFVDDLFAIALTLAGFALGDSTLLVVALGLYLLVGLFTGPLLTRLTWIHFRIGLALIHKLRRKAGAERGPLERPAWLTRAMEAKGIDPSRAHSTPCYAYGAREAGRCRAGFLVLGGDAVYFATRIMWRPTLVAFPHERLTRIGLAQSTTARTIAISETTPAGGIDEVVLYLFPSVEEDILPELALAADATRLRRVKPDSESARRGLPGYAQRGKSVRFILPLEAGSLRTQALLTIGGAIVAGVLTGGLFIPIGLGYALSPFPRRFFLGLFASACLTLAILGTMGFGWPVALIYAVLLNTVALRDMARAALKARVDGYVDKRAFLPSVSERVWVPESRLLTASDAWKEGDPVPLTDAPWRTVVALIAEGEDGEARVAA